MFTDPAVSSSGSGAADPAPLHPYDPVEVISLSFIFIINNAFFIWLCYYNRMYLDHCSACVTGGI